LAFINNRERYYIKVVVEIMGHKIQHTKLQVLYRAMQMTWVIVIVDRNYKYKT